MISDAMKLFLFLSSVLFCSAGYSKTDFEGRYFFSDSLHYGVRVSAFKPEIYFAPNQKLFRFFELNGSKEELIPTFTGFWELSDDKIHIIGQGFEMHGVILEEGRYIHINKMCAYKTLEQNRRKRKNKPAILEEVHLFDIRKLSKSGTFTEAKEQINKLSIYQCDDYHLTLNKDPNYQNPEYTPLENLSCNPDFNISDGHWLKARFEKVGGREGIDELCAK